MNSCSRHGLENLTSTGSRSRFPRLLRLPRFPQHVLQGGCPFRHRTSAAFRITVESPALSFRSHSSRRTPVAFGRFRWCDDMPAVISVAGISDNFRFRNRLCAVGPLCYSPHSAGAQPRLNVSCSLSESLVCLPQLPWTFRVGRAAAGLILSQQIMRGLHFAAGSASLTGNTLILSEQRAGATGIPAPEPAREPAPADVAGSPSSCYSADNQTSQSYPGTDRRTFPVS